MIKIKLILTIETQGDIKYPNNGYETIEDEIGNCLQESIIDFGNWPTDTIIKLQKWFLTP